MSSFLLTLPLAVVLAICVYAIYQDYRFTHRRTRGIYIDVTPGKAI